MTDEKYILDCPHCGDVAGYASTELQGEREDVAPPDEDSVIEEDVFETSSGPVQRVRCPQCGRWVSTDRMRPE